MGNFAQVLAELRASGHAQVCLYYTGYRYYFTLAGGNLVITPALILQSVLQQIVGKEKRNVK